MKKSLSRHRTNIPRIPYSKSSINKVSLDLSNPGQKKISIRNKNDSMNKETVDGSCFDNQTFVFNQDSLSNSKITENKNHSLGKLDNKLLVFTSSLKYTLNKRNKSLKLSKNMESKTYEDCSENISSSDDDIIFMENNINNEEDEDTNKIDYRYYPKIPEIEANKDNNSPYYWLATYDKLMKKSKIVKILNYYSDSLSHKESEIFIIEDANSDYKEEESKQRIKKMNEKYNFKEKTMIIQGYEIYFVNKHGKPFIRQNKEGKLFIKLYLLNLEQINQIFSYINRLEYKQYINNLHSFTEKNTFKIINNYNKSIYNYSTIFCLGTFMNINIYLLTHCPKNYIEESNDNYSYNINDLPSSNKIAKIIKALIMNFPDFSKQYFIDYLMKPKEKNFELGTHDLEILQQKMVEVNSLIMTNNKKVNKKTINNTNNIIKNIIKGIPTYTPTSLYTPNNFNSFSKSNITSAFNKLDNNYNISKNHEINCSDFLSNIKSELDGIANSPNNNISNIYEYPKTISKPLKKIKLNNTSDSRNITKYNMNISNNKSIHTIYNLKEKISDRKNINQTSSLIEPVRKSLTRNNSNNFIHYKKAKNNKTDINYKNKNQQNIEFSLKNKENTNILNKNLINEYMFSNNNIFSNNKNNNNFKTNIFKKGDSGKSSKVTRNKNIISPFYTNNNNNSNSNSKEIDNNTQNIKKIKFKQPIRVLSSIRKVISQKMNNISDNTNSFFKLNKSDSNSSIKNTRYLYENSNFSINTSKYNKVVCKTNNNSLNKKTNYITPLKKKFFYYYQ